MRIYLDTNLWNISLDQKVDVIGLVDAIDKRGGSLVLGQHAFFELLKTFKGTSPLSQSRAKDLFHHLRSYLQAGLRCVAKDLYECVVAEMYALQGVSGTEKFLSSDDIFKVWTESELLANGSVRQEWHDHIAKQKAATQLDCKRQLEFCENNPTQSAKLRSVESAKVVAWLEEELDGPLGLSSLTRHLKLRFPEVITAELQIQATEMLRCRAKASCALVRSELYFNWYCAAHGSIPGDLLDDMTHVINASYCDVYATEESKQAQYASLLLPQTTRVHIYKRTQRLDMWLLRLVG